MEEKLIQSICEEIKLYKPPISQNSGDSMKAEKLFSDLKKDAGQIFKVIKDTCEKADTCKNAGLKEGTALAVELDDNEIRGVF